MAEPLRVPCAMTAAKTDISLEDIRRKIDEIDDGLLRLLVRRFAASAMVGATKKDEGSLASSPFRPAREAQMLRRLISHGGNELPPQLLVRLWRVILSASAQAQATVTIHLDCALSSNIEHRVAIARHFCGMAIVSHSGVASCLSTLARQTGDLAVVQLSSDWADWLSQPSSHGVHVIGTLPVIAAGSTPELLVLGHAETQPSGDDETIMICQHEPLPVSPRCRWQARSGDWHVTSVGGFLSRDDLARRWPGFVLAGRCPTAIEVSQ